MAKNGQRISGTDKKTRVSGVFTEALFILAKAFDQMMFFSHKNEYHSNH